jgi:hypothetical protein
MFSPIHKTSNGDSNGVKMVSTHCIATATHKTTPPLHPIGTSCCCNHVKLVKQENDGGVNESQK